MVKRDAAVAAADWPDTPTPLMRPTVVSRTAVSQTAVSQTAASRTAKTSRAAKGFRLEVGQRFHRVGLMTVIWRVVRVYRDAQGLEHAVLASNRPDLDPKTLSASVLLDRRRYRAV